ncbi:MULTISPECIES: phosphotransferase [unclassified Streptomyces]|uniref:phosphotransferase n=1 Tax=unclassified Streptomyces TaxID=2593676 RepID=UPI00036CD0C5|nr:MULTISPECIES: phosphotransferase [unclassified Streptomyces]MYY06780.1 phosphotransferase [Streptomyces sp. SID4913]
MHGETSVDRGQYPDAVAPWDDLAWRQSALAWAERALAARGRPRARLLAVRVRPWSVLVRMSAAGGPDVWLKANPPASAFEAGLTEALARWVPGHVLEPLAVDVERGWSLFPHGGTLFREVHPDGTGERAWAEALHQYAVVQRALVSRVEEITRLGVPDARTAVLPAVFDRVVGRNTVLDTGTRTALHALRPRLVRWCEELDALGVPDSLDHSDLHDGQLFTPAPGRFTFFDWGDASVSHPFCSLFVPLNNARERYGPQALPRLRDAYLDAWTGTGPTTAELRRGAALARHLGAIGRACSWDRLFPEASRGLTAMTEAGAARSLRQLLADPAL